MSFLGLLNQTLTIYNKTSYNETGREVVGSGTSVTARVQRTTKRTLLPNGNIQVIDLIAYVPPGTTVATDDRADFGSDKFKVFNKYEAVSGSGATQHIKLELTKWKET